MIDACAACACVKLIARAERLQHTSVWFGRLNGNALLDYGTILRLASIVSSTGPHLRFDHLLLDDRMTSATESVVSRTNAQIILSSSVAPQFNFFLVWEENYTASCCSSSL